MRSVPSPFSFKITSSPHIGVTRQHPSPTSLGDWAFVFLGPTTRGYGWLPRALAEATEVVCKKIHSSAQEDQQSPEGFKRIVDIS